MRQETKGDWVEIPKGGYGINARTGHLINLKTGKPLSVYRIKSVGTIVGIIPFNKGVPGIGKGRIHQVGRLILSGLHGGAPHPNPRSVLALPKDGNKWNTTPSNLEWVTRVTFTQNRVMSNDVHTKLNGHLVFTIRDIASALAHAGIKDNDALGSVFHVSGDTITKVINNWTWGYVGNYLSQSEDNVDFNRSLFIRKALDAADLYSRRDDDLNSYLSDIPHR